MEIMRGVRWPDLLMPRQELQPPRKYGIGFEDLLRREEVHERVVLERFRAAGFPGPGRPAVTFILLAGCSEPDHLPGLPAVAGQQ
jgi:hypothetical protein